MGKQTGKDLNAISVSRDGKWVVCGTTEGASVWDAELQRKIVEVEDTDYVNAVDISPEPTRFATGTGSVSKKASIWSITTGGRLVGPLQHDEVVRGIKFSPDGRHIATASTYTIYIFDSYNGDQLITIKSPVPNHYSTIPIVWPSDGRLFAISRDGKIKSFDMSTGSQLAEWQVHSHNSSNPISIALSANNSFIACSSDRSVSFWDTSTHTQLGSVLEHDDEIRGIAFSPNGGHLAIGGDNNETITIWNLSDILPESNVPVKVSTTLPMLEWPITFVYQSTFL